MKLTQFKTVISGAILGSLILFNMQAQAAGNNTEAGFSPDRCPSCVSNNFNKDLSHLQTAEDALKRFASKNESKSKYSHLDPQGVVPKNLLAAALEEYEATNNRHPYIAVADMSIHSSKKRFFLIDMKSGRVESFTVSHGRGSDPDGDGWATRFSNSENSHMTSLGAYKTLGTYTGKHGLSLKLEGLDSTNSEALDRAIVIHGASYVSPGRAGRSHGCPAFSPTDSKYIISKLKGGAIMYIGATKYNQQASKGSKNGGRS